MAHLVAAEIVVPSALDSSSKRTLVDALYGVQARIFGGVDRASFTRYVVDSKAEKTRIQLYRDGAGRIGGYLAVHFFEREIGGEQATVIRVETGILREHRGGNIIGAFLLKELVAYRFENPGRKLCYLGALVHPSSYTQLVQYFDGVWPCPGATTPAPVQALMEDLGGSFGLAQVNDENSLVREVGWKTIDSAADRAYWRQSDRPGVQFFLDANPGYEDGHGLLTLIELSLGGLLRTVGRYVSAKASRRARRMVEAVRRDLRALLPVPALRPRNP